jgi:hypothetical protein
MRIEILVMGATCEQGPTAFPAQGPDQFQIGPGRRINEPIWQSVMCRPGYTLVATAPALRLHLHRSLNEPV